MTDLQVICNTITFDLVYQACDVMSVHFASTDFNDILNSHVKHLCLKWLLSALRIIFMLMKWANYIFNQSKNNKN